MASWKTNLCFFRVPKMNTKHDVWKILSHTLGEFAEYLKAIDDKLGDAYALESIFPAFDPVQLSTIAGNTIPPNLFDYVKNDLGQANPEKGHIEFKTVAALFGFDPLNNGNQEPKPIVLFTWPPQDSTNPTNSIVRWEWGVDLLWELNAFSLDYDFTDDDYDVFTFNNITIALDCKSVLPDSAKLETIWTTPPIPMTIKVKIPKHLNLNMVLPIILFDIMGVGVFNLSLNLNFDWVDLHFSPLNFNFPDWFGLKLSISFEALLKLDFDCEYFFTLLLPNVAIFKLEFPDINVTLPNFRFLLDWLNFDSQSLASFKTYTEVDPVEGFPKWGAVYVEIGDAFGPGFKVGKLFLMLGISLSDQRLKVGFLVCTDNIQALDNKSFMLRGALITDFGLEESNEGVSLPTTSKKLQAHPGFMIELLSGESANTLATSAQCPSPSKPEVTFGGVFSIRVGAIGMEWDKDLDDYVIYADGEFTIKQLLYDSEKKSSSNSGSPWSDLILPFKGLGFTPSGDIVLRNSWVILKEGKQVQLDGFDAVQMFIEGFGYQKTADGHFEGFGYRC
jgi:hypothetical protein